MPPNYRVKIKQAILQYHVVNAKAAEMKITLTDADQESLKSTLQTNITNYCGSSGTEDQFNTYLSTLYMTWITTITSTA